MPATLRPLGHAPGSQNESDWHDALARAFATVGDTLYAYVDATTHAPITPIAPIPGHVGIRADIKRAHPGLDALPVADSTPDARRRFAGTLAALADSDARAAADTLARAVEYTLTAATPGTRPDDATRAAYAADKLTARAHRLTSESIERRARAAAILATLA